MKTHAKQTTKQPKCGDFNMYRDERADAVILEVYGIGGELIYKHAFASFDAARQHIRANY